VQKRVAAGKAEPQFVQNEVTVMVDTLTALPQEPTIALDPAIISTRASLLAGSARLSGCHYRAHYRALGPVSCVTSENRHELSEMQ